MAVSMAQYTVPTSPENMLIAVVPPGYTAIISTTATSDDVFLGSTAAVTSGNGAPLPNTAPLLLHNPKSEAAFPVYACAGTGTHVVGVIIISTS